MRRAVALIASLTLLLLGVTACGDDSTEATNSGTVTVTGEFGQEPKVEYDGRVVRTETEEQVLVEGDGPVVEEGGAAFLHFYIGNGYTGEKAASTWEKQPGQKELHPQYVVDGGGTLEPLRRAMVGKAVGSRVLVLASPEDAYGGQGQPDFGIGNQDSVVFVVDVVDKALEAPEGTEKPLPPGLPSVVEEDGKVTGLDFSEAGEPGSGLRVVPLVQGTGEKVRAGAPVALRYLGQVWDGKEPFDENFTAEFPGMTNPQTGQVDPAVFGSGGFIAGWDEGIPGQRIGSRLMLVVPPDKGYGRKDQGKDIPPNATLVFVVDLLGQG